MGILCHLVEDQRQNNSTPSVREAGLPCNLCPLLYGMEKIECVNCLRHDYSQGFLQLEINLLLDPLSCLLSYSILRDGDGAFGTLASCQGLAHSWSSRGGSQRKHQNFYIPCSPEGTSTPDVPSCPNSRCHPSSNICHFSSFTHTISFRAQGAHR